MKSKNKTNKGITLIALVITIIILLILAGITIAELTGNGLFDKVKLAKEKSEQKQQEENATLGDYENQIEKYINTTRESSGYNITKLGEVTGKEVIKIDAKKFDELYIEAEYGGAHKGSYCEYNIKTITINEELKYYIGNAHCTVGGVYSVIIVKDTEISLYSMRTDSVDCTDSSTLVVYGINY